jgi:hypothetical protein
MGMAPQNPAPNPKRGLVRLPARRKAGRGQPQPPLLARQPRLPNPPRAGSAKRTAPSCKGLADILQRSC